MITSKMQTVMELEQKSPPIRRPRTVLVARSGWAAIDVLEVWAYRDLLWMLIIREIKLRYNQAVLGVAWVLLQPLLAAIIFYIIFGLFAKMPSGGSHYLPFVFSGLVAWSFFPELSKEAATAW